MINIMKQLKLFSLFFIVACLLFSCNGNQNAANVKDSSASATTTSGESTTANGSGDGSFSYKIDGQTVSGSGTDDLNHFNRVFKKDTGNRISFTLMNLDHSDKKPLELDLQIANKGTTVVTIDDNDRLSSGNNVTNFFTLRVSTLYGGSPNYDLDSTVTVTITSDNSSRVTGTFSGSLKSDANKKVLLTDGTFDLPYWQKK